MHPASIVLEPSARYLHNVYLYVTTLPRYAYCGRYIRSRKKLYSTSVHGVLQQQSLSASRCSSLAVI